MLFNSLRARNLGGLQVFVMFAKHRCTRRAAPSHWFSPFGSFAVTHLSTFLPYKITMDTINRRTFLKSTGGLAAAAALSAAVLQAASSQIKHIIVVMMENRSFDHFPG